MIAIDQIKSGMYLEIELVNENHAMPRGARKGKKLIKQGLAQWLGYPLGGDWLFKPLVAAVTLSPTEPDQLIAYYWHGSRERKAGWYSGPRADDILEI